MITCTFSLQTCRRVTCVSPCPAAAAAAQLHPTLRPQAHSLSQCTALPCRSVCSCCTPPLWQMRDSIAGKLGHAALNCRLPRESKGGKGGVRALTGRRSAGPASPCLQNPWPFEGPAQPGHCLMHGPPGALPQRCWPPPPAHLHAPCKRMHGRAPAGKTLSILDGHDQAQGSAAGKRRIMPQARSPQASVHLL